MKIDFFISSLSSGGAEHVLTNLASSFADNGHDVSIVSFEKRPQFYKVSEKVEVNKFDYTKEGKLKELYSDYKEMRHHIKKRKADVSISFLSRCNVMLIIAALFKKTKVIVCDRNNLEKKYGKFIFWIHCLFYSLADAVIVQTNEIKEKYPAYLQKKIEVLENPLHFQELNSQCSDFDLEKKKTIISIGRLEKQKDFKTLINSFYIISERYPDWKLEIYGKGNMKEELQQFIEELQLSDKVLLHGVTTTPFLEMKKAKIFVLSSLYEGFPNVLCEAMYAGLPCISTRCECGPADLIEDGVSGFLVPVGEPQKIAEKLEFLISNEEIQNRMGNNARKSVERLEYNQICNKWLRVIEKVIKQR